MKKKIILLITLASMMLTMLGCAELVSCETETIEVTIVDSYHRSAWLQPVRAGKVTTFITHPATYSITFEYEDRTYSISGQDVYEKYKNKIGQTTTATLEIKTYDNGKVYTDIVGLE